MHACHASYAWAYMYAIVGKLEVTIAGDDGAGGKDVRPDHGLHRLPRALQHAQPHQRHPPVESADQQKPDREGGGQAGGQAKADVAEGDGDHARNHRRPPATAVRRVAPQDRGEEPPAEHGGGKQTRDKARRVRVGGPAAVDGEEAGVREDARDGERVFRT
mgnify:CR=1 FL=1